MQRPFSTSPALMAHLPFGDHPQGRAAKQATAWTSARNYRQIATKAQDLLRPNVRLHLGPNKRAGILFRRPNRTPFSQPLGLPGPRVIWPLGYRAAGPGEGTPGNGSLGTMAVQGPWRPFGPGRQFNPRVTGRRFTQPRAPWELGALTESTRPNNAKRNHRRTQRQTLWGPLA